MQSIIMLYKEVRFCGFLSLIASLYWLGVLYLVDNNKAKYACASQYVSSFCRNERTALNTA